MLLYRYWTSAAPPSSTTNPAKAMPLARAGRPAQVLRVGGGISKGMPWLYSKAAGAGGQPRDCTVTLAFVSNNSFAATSSFPPKEVSDAYKMNMGRWQPDTKRWTFPLEQYDKLAARLESICRTRIAGFNLSFKGIPDAVMHILRVTPGRCAPAVTHSNISAAKASQEAQILFEKLPQHLRQNLMEFQREGVLFGLARNGRLLIGDEMGLGKTVQVYAIKALLRPYQGSIKVLC